MMSQRIAPVPTMAIVAEQRQLQDRALAGRDVLGGLIVPASGKGLTPFRQNRQPPEERASLFRPARCRQKVGK